MPSFLVAIYCLLGEPTKLINQSAAAESVGDRLKKLRMFLKKFHLWNIHTVYRNLSA